MRSFIVTPLPTTISHPSLDRSAFSGAGIQPRTAREWGRLTQLHFRLSPCRPQSYCGPHSGCEPALVSLGCGPGALENTDAKDHPWMRKHYGSPGDQQRSSAIPWEQARQVWARWRGSDLCQPPHGGHRSEPRETSARDFSYKECESLYMSPWHPRLDKMPPFRVLSRELHDWGWEQAGRDYSGEGPTDCVTDSIKKPSLEPLGALHLQIPQRAHAFHTHTCTHTCTHTRAHPVACSLCMLPMAGRTSFGSLPLRPVESQSGSVDQGESTCLSISSTLGKAKAWIHAG